MPEAQTRDPANRHTQTPDPDLIGRCWSILLDRGYLRTSVLPYFRSLSHLPREPLDLLRYRQGRRQSARAAWPPLYYRLFRRSDPELFDLFTLFSLSAPIPRSRFAAIFSPPQTRLFEEAGLVRIEDERACPLLRVYLRGAQAFFHDAPGSGISLFHRGYMARDSLRFADYLVASLSGRRFDRALDIGTGCGVQAHVLAAHAGSVVGIDRNPRALLLASANAAINRAENIRFVRGDLAEPLRGGFDLVVSNPPFIYLPRPLPDGTDLASDGGGLGIAVPRRILARLDGLLAPGGEARILTAVPRVLPSRGRGDGRNHVLGANPASESGTAAGGGVPNARILERWIERRLLPRGLTVTLRFVEYLWRDDQLDAYAARDLATPALAVAEVRRAEDRRLTVTPAPLGERLILTRRLAARRASSHLHRVARGLSALQPSPAIRRGRGAAMLLAQTERTPQTPLVLCLEPSTCCPLDCISCARAERIGRGDRMDPALFEKLLAETRPEAVRLYGSGEPLDHPEIDRLCRTVREAGARVTLQTSLADEALIARAARTLPFLDRLIIALDAATDDTYAAIRRNGSFATAVEGVRFLVRSRARLGLRSPDITLSFLILGRNIHELSDFVRSAFRLGTDGALFQAFDGYGIEDRVTALRGAIRMDELSACLRKANRAANRIGLSTNLATLLNSTPLLQHGYTEEPLVRHGTCSRPWLSSFVRVNGDVRPCARYPYGPQGHLGNAAAESFRQDIWNGPGYRALRRHLRGGRKGSADVAPSAGPEPRAHEATGFAPDLRTGAATGEVPDFAACRGCPVPMVEGVVALARRRSPGRAS
jgi:MoaA/NifB/PqqE/SkfB family radical SAM enzyme/SAM-dependent methyltransferase